MAILKFLMMILNKTFILFLLLPWYLTGQNKLDRKAIVERHQVMLNDMDTLAAFSVGNGQFAFTVDATGLQTFPVYYQNGIPLGTQSEWAWHSFPDDGGYTIEETIKYHETHGRQVPYTRQWPADTRQGKAANYLRQNPHRLQMANIGWKLMKKNGQLAQPEDISNIRQSFNPWTGEIRSYFELEGDAAEVLTFADQQNDGIGVKAAGELVTSGRLSLLIKFPSPTDQFLDNAAYYGPLENQQISSKKVSAKSLSIFRQIDTTGYRVNVHSNLAVTYNPFGPISFEIGPKKKKDWSVLIHFTPERKYPVAASFDNLFDQARASWQQFWESGGMIDFGNTEDPRAKELERRMILSLYQTKINCGGSMPPQETGLVQNSWYGKPHLEMAWWHGVHFALWGRPEILESQMQWYLKNRDKARIIAERQGFKGVRWQKMTDPWGNETASSVGAYLIWQQPHPIYFAELIYRNAPTEAVLRKYQELVEATAEFMADFAYRDPELDRYILGNGVIPAQERFHPDSTFNPTYELAYWRWGLETAQKWRERLGRARNSGWDQVLAHLSPLPEKDGFYLATASAPDSYTNKRFMTDHPSVLGTLGMLPQTNGLNIQIMENTFEKIWKDWVWEDTWGWDFPMTAMTATRLGKPDKAIDALLMPIRTNTYLKNGHNYQDNRLRLYLPGNGGLLTALAMMTAGYDGSKELPGIPANWKVKVDGLAKMP